MSTSQLRRFCGTAIPVLTLSLATVAQAGAEEAKTPPPAAPNAAAAPADPGRHPVDAKWNPITPAADAAPVPDKIEKVGPGEINWTKKTLKVTGVGAPNLKAPNVAVARIGAEAAGKYDALRNVLQTLKGVQIESGKTVGDSMSGDKGIATKIEGKVKNWKIVDTRYFSDGGVEIDVEVDLDGEMGALLLPDTGTKVAEERKNAKPTSFTGVIFDASGLGLAAALAPRVYDASGNFVFGPDVVSPEAAKDGGVAVYVANVDLAKKEARAGQNPLVIKATGISKTAKSDLVVPNEDATKLEDLGGLIVDGKVVIVAN